MAHLVGAPLGESSLNPARSIDPAVFEGSKAISILWVFVVAPIAGGVIGWLLYKLIYDAKDQSASS